MIVRRRADRTLDIAGQRRAGDLLGNCVGSFGQPADGAGDFTQFDTVSGIWVDAAGSVYVADAGAARILKFDPFVTEPVQSEPPGEATAEAVG